MDQKQQHQFEILRRLALAGSRGEELRPTVEIALQMAVDAISLEAAGLYLWDDKMKISLTVAHSVSEDARRRLGTIEEGLFRRLRKEEQLLSAYMSFGGDSPSQSFTMPLRHGKLVFGAIVGVQQGEGRLISEDLLLEAITAAIALNVIASGGGKDIELSQELIDKERLRAIIETAVTVNHEINNPLTAILGNIQLILLNNENLDEKVADKLRTMELSAMKIKDITQRLLRVNSAKTVKYTEGTSMLDLSDTDDLSDSDPQNKK